MRLSRGGDETGGGNLSFRLLWRSCIEAIYAEQTISRAAQSSDEAASHSPGPRISLALTMTDSSNSTSSTPGPPSKPSRPPTRSTYGLGYGHMGMWA